MSFAQDRAGLLRTLSSGFKGRIDTSLEALAEVATDFGRVVYRQPQIVVKPVDVADVVTVIKAARELGWKIAVRGAGHSQGGQALSQEGVVVDTRGLSGVEALNKAEGWVVVRAGTLWRTLVQTVAPEGLLPPVLTDNLEVTIGGTLAVGGLGPASFRDGLQAHHCLGLEVVLGTGEVTWLTPEKEPQLYHHLLCGLGQFGLVTSVKLQLRPYRRYVRTVYLSYQNIEGFLRDALVLMKGEQIHFLEGAAHPAGRATGGGAPQYRYLLEVSTEFDEPATVDNRQFMPEVGGEAQRSVVTRETRDYLFRLWKTFAKYKRPVAGNEAHPWVEHLLPVPAVKTYLEAVTATFPATPLLLWPLPAQKLRLPMFAVPDSPEIMLVGLMTGISPVQVAETLPQLRRASELGIALGGKRYLSGWLDFDREQWRQHFGPAQWQQILALKQQCDPDGVFQSPLFC